MPISLELKIKVDKIQSLLAKSEFDGFLLYMIKDQNSYAKHLLEIKPTVNLSRRFFYFIPKKGVPIKIVNKVDLFPLRVIYGRDYPYLGRKQLEKLLNDLLPKKICMQYSANAYLPTHSVVDAGTFELLKSFDIQIGSSEMIIQKLESELSPSQIKEHFISEKVVDTIALDAFSFCRDQINEGVELYERDVQEFIMTRLDKNGFVYEGKPICAVNANSSNPHYEIEGRGSSIRNSDFLLLDLWAKRNCGDGVYADITRVACFGEPSERQRQVFNWVRHAQKEAVKLIESRFNQGKVVYGWEVDKVCFDYLHKEGVSNAISHRTGHNITGELHGPGANLDNLESIDTRPLLKNTCYSVEPALYFDGQFGLRLEHDILVDSNGLVHVTGGIQDEIYRF